MTEKLQIKVRSLPMSEMFQIKEVTGRSLLGELRENGTKALDEQLVAGLVWMVRRRENPQLTFEEVFSTLDLDWVEANVVIDLRPTNLPSPAAVATTRKPSRPSSGSTRPGRRAH